MRKVNLKDVEWQDRHSPKGKFGRRMKVFQSPLGALTETTSVDKVVACRPSK